MVSFTAIATLALALCLPSMEALQDAHVTGAFYLGTNLYLFDQQGRALAITPDGHSSVYQPGTLGAPRDFAIGAAYFYPGHWNIPEFIYLGNHKIWNGRVLNYNTDKDNYRYKFPDFLWQGVDAATTEGSTSYFFKGCWYITKNNYGQFDTNQRPVSQLNVPCNVQAAWNDGTKTLVLKGNEIWTVNGDNTTTPFQSYRRQSLWNLV